ncbi:hypothetical protein HMPREF9488_03231 [Coprobacillus cateniformis]|uniref:Uncharacterized protein n=1 Tax=Coprobacillus cateniformis TaxID=100884 RepID=E7GET9_9FIRM|nr:hypothetical protein [Coprobacillus cateniformis]EFW03540.1 hypothetical protein HMPREF9488_03231 [Coprobacillus cateniformis]RGO15784.1 hypothetical protein DXB30_08100 [Coprobacillus cateniformis]RGO24945.1 hypothetical protein DXB26_08190 [Coprobacillus cateniformis]RGY48730.1 hypothetical protein DXA41_04775 [Coprobacillus cateniformis]
MACRIKPALKKMLPSILFIVFVDVLECLATENTSLITTIVFTSIVDVTIKVVSYFWRHEP